MCRPVSTRNTKERTSLPRGTKRPLLFLLFSPVSVWLPGGASGKEPANQSRRCKRPGLGLIPELGRSPGGRHGKPLQDSCLKSPMDRGVWRATIHRVAESRTWTEATWHTPDTYSVWSANTGIIIVTLTRIIEAMVISDFCSQTTRHCAE